MRRLLLSLLVTFILTGAYAQEENTSRLTIGGYGEAVLTRNFYSQHFNRYKDPESYKSDGSHGRFDLPHVVINLGYDFGHGWTMGSEIEFEHGGTGGAVEVDADESGEYEAETETGGEVNLEQFWINKEFAKGLFNIKAGEIIVPVGLANQHHLPNEFFTVYRPEGESTILPNTWHQVGVSFWGRAKDFRYEFQFLSGLDSERFKATNFIHYGATSTYEFKIANTYAVAGRLDNYSVKGLRIGISGYVGNTFSNTLRAIGTAYKDVKGQLAIASADFQLKRWNWIVRGNATYAHLSDAIKISEFNNAFPKHSLQDGSPSSRQPVAKGAYAAGIEAGYDIFSQISSLKNKEKLYLFSRFEKYNAMASSVNRSAYEYCNTSRVAAGINYLPVSDITIKAEWSERFLPKQYNNEPSISVGITYAGFFSRK